MKFRFVDKIVAWSPYESISGIKAVSFEEYSLKESFGDEPRLPETLLLESFLQLGNWLILLSSDFKEASMVVRISEVNFRGFLLPGKQLRMEVKLVRQREDGFELSGEGREDGEVIISGMGCLATPVPAEELLDPADWRVQFSEIFAPEEGVPV